MNASPTPLSHAEVRRLTTRIQGFKVEVAEEVTDVFFRRHPEWLDRYGEGGVKHGIQDALFHLDFVVGALQGGDPKGFADYARWAGHLLNARGLAPLFLIENLREIRTALLQRIPDSREGASVAHILDQGIQAVEAVGRNGDGPPSTPLSQMAEVYLGAILSGSRKAAVGVMDEAIRSGVSVMELYLNVLQPAQQRVGELWASQAISVSDEHSASAVTQYILAHLYPHLPQPDQVRGSAVVTGVEGEMHQMGAHMVSDVLEADGWQVRFLGTQLPHASIVQTVVDEGAELVGISVTLLANLPAAASLIRDLRAKVGGGNLKVLVGGLAFGMGATGWREVGADGHASNLMTARDLARTLHHLSGRDS